MTEPTEPNDLAQRGAQAIAVAFAAYHIEFRAITHRARASFERCDWQRGQQDAVERLELYTLRIDALIEELHALLADQVKTATLWNTMKRCYAGLTAGRDDVELAETFFNSATRRIFATIGVDHAVEFVAPAEERRPRSVAQPVYRRYSGEQQTAALLRRILTDLDFAVPYEDIERDAQLAAGVIDRHVTAASISRCEIVRSVFYRNKGAYIVGRLWVAGRVVPLVLALLNSPQGIAVDAVLLTEDDISIIFSFARSYFHVEVEQPRQMIEFLRSIMPLKPVAELYTSLGYNKHGKTELYRDLLRHIAQSDDLFEVARGERGMVMAVFTLPSFDVVFKIIKDRFSEPKTTTRQDVLNRYQLVFRHDRAGRLIDAQEFEHLKFDRARFAPALLEELLQVAAQSVTVEGDNVIIKHLYTERRTTPLNLYLKEAPEAARRAAVIDYGYTRPGRRQYFPRRYSAQKLRRDPSRPCRLLRL